MKIGRMALCFMMLSLVMLFKATQPLGRVAAQEKPDRPAAGGTGGANAGGGVNAAAPVAAAKVQTRATLRLPGVQPGGVTLLPNQWSLQPAGKHLALGDFPVTIAIHPTENVAAILHAGYGEHEVVLVDLAKFEIVSRVSLSETFVGLAFSPDGKTLFASGAGQEIVHRFAYAGGYLSDRRVVKIAEPKEKRVPAGLVTSADGGTLYVACPWGNTVEIVSVANAETRRQVRLKEDDYPHSPLTSRDGKRLYVSLWGRSAVSVWDVDKA